MGLYAREDDVIRDAVTRLKQAMPGAMPSSSPPLPASGGTGSGSKYQFRIGCGIWIPPI